LIESSRELNL